MRDTSSNVAKRIFISRYILDHKVEVAVLVPETPRWMGLTVLVGG